MKIEELFENTTNTFANSLILKYELDDLFLYKKSDNILIIGNFVVNKDKRKDGIGTKVMNDIIEYADMNNLIVACTPALTDDRMGTTSRFRLVAFYKRFGFIENKGRNKDFTIPHSLYRIPNIS